jgi:hypothetical protein
MGYSQTVILVLGVELSNEQARIISEKHIDGVFIQYETEDCITDEVLCSSQGKDVFNERNVPELLADGADSRIDDMGYCVDCERHVIGITLASRGRDRIENHFGNVQQKAYDNFNKYILPILTEEGIDKKPELLIVCQVW